LAQDQINQGNPAKYHARIDCQISTSAVAEARSPPADKRKLRTRQMKPYFLTLLVAMTMAMADLRGRSSPRRSYLTLSVPKLAANFRRLRAMRKLP
jgi:hypothetical protein